MELVGYVRVSTERQAVEGVSVDAQRERVSAWATATGADLLAVHVDAGVSGKRADNRPGLQAALRDACRHRCPLVVYSLSRLARSTRDAIAIADRLERCGADLISLSERLDTTTAAGKLFFRLMASMAEFERDLACERTRTAMAHKRDRGERISRRLPYGFNLAADGRTLEPNADEQRGVDLIRQLRGDGLSYGRIAAELERRGMANKSGAVKWTAGVVHGIYKRAG